MIRLAMICVEKKNKDKTLQIYVAHIKNQPLIVNLLTSGPYYIRFLFFINTIKISF